MEKQPKFELAIFDWNGTLLDDLSVVYESIVEIFKAYKLPAPTLEQYRNEIETDFMKFYYDHGTPKEVTADDLNAIRKAYLIIHGQKAHLRPEAKELLFLCQKLKMSTAIVSGEREDMLLEKLKQLKISPFFNVVRSNSWEKEKVLVEVLDQLIVPAEKAFYLDDSVDGLQSAKNLGIVTIGFTAGYCPETKILGVKPDFQIDSLEKVMEIIIARNEL